jgi:hypothetical protein
MRNFKQTQKFKRLLEIIANLNCINQDNAKIYYVDDLDNDNFQYQSHIISVTHHPERIGEEQCPFQLKDILGNRTEYWMNIIGFLDIIVNQDRKVIEIVLTIEKGTYEGEIAWSGMSFDHEYVIQQLAYRIDRHFNQRRDA